METSNQPLEPNSPKKQPFNSFLKYSGLAMQMGATIALLAWLGYWLDGYFHTSKPFLTLAFLLVGTITSILSLIRQLR